MTTIYRNAASVAEARVLELTAQWENSLKSKNAESKAGTSRGDDSQSSTSTSEEDDRPKYPYPESAQTEDGKEKKRPS